MTWARFDDRFWNDRKIRDLPLAAVGLHAKAITFCCHDLTDGFLRGTDVRRLGGSKRWADILVAAGVWTEEIGGWRIHDFLEYHPSAEEVRQRRQMRAEAGRRGGLASGEAKRTANAIAPTAKQTQSKREPRPVPTRPVPVTTIVEDLRARLGKEPM
jgi:hypothetical protein